MPLHTKSRLRLLAISMLVATATTAHAQIPGSYSYEFKLDAGVRNDKEIHGTVRVSGGRARLDTDEHNKGHDYLLVTDGGNTVVVVHPDEQTYESHGADDFARVVSLALRAAGPVFKVTVREVHLDTARLGAGGTVAGRQTQHVQMRQRWHASVHVMGFTKDNMGGNLVGDYWADPSLPLMRNPLYDIISTSLTALASADPEFLASGADARMRLFRGSPLKADVRVHMDEGDSDSTRLLYEVVKFTPGAVDESALEIPKGYRRTTASTFHM